MPSMKTKPIPAVPCRNTYKGKRYYRFAVVTRVSTLAWSRETVHRNVIAASASDAIELVREDVYRAFAKNPKSLRPVEFFTWGVKGGETHRFSGWESCVAGAMAYSVIPKMTQRDWVVEAASAAA